MQHNRWDHALKVTADGKGLVGHAGAILLRKAADQLGLTAGLSAALLRKGTAPLLDPGTVLASLAVAIALGATSMSDIALLAHLAPVLGDAPSGPTVRRALDLARAPTMLERVARARGEGERARVEAHRGHPHRVPLAGHRGQDPDGLAGHRHYGDIACRLCRSAGYADRSTGTGALQQLPGKIVGIISGCYGQRLSYSSL